MKKCLWLLPFLFLVIACLGSVRLPRSRSDCYAPSQCECHIYNDGETYLGCKNGSLKAWIKPAAKNVFVTCHDEFTYMDYDLLNNSMTGSVERVEFFRCPMPSMPFGKLLQSIGLQVTKEFIFQPKKSITVDLEAKPLKGLEDIAILDLPDNGFTNLPDIWLQGMYQLTALNLAANKIYHLHKHFFLFVPKLEYLILRNNKLTLLNVEIFNHLTKLKELDLSGNKLQSLPKNIFSELVSLDKLDISRNEFQTLPDDLFRNLRKLVNLGICSKSVLSIPESFVFGNSRVQEIRLHDNKEALELPEYFLANLSQLKKVYLMRNNLTNINETIFTNSSSITDIFLQESSITSLPKNLFSHQIYLRTLNLSCNQIEEIADFTFEKLTGLQTLWLSYNRLEEISSDVFRGLYQLESLHLENNGLKYLHHRAFNDLIKLKEIYLSNNLLTFEDKYHFLPKDVRIDPLYNDSPIGSCKSIENVYLSNNSIRIMFKDLKSLSNLRTLDMSYNKFQILNLQDIDFKYDDVKLDLQNNDIRIINFYRIQDRPMKRRVNILLDGNPLKCDCRAYEFINYLKYDIQPKISLSVSNLTCNESSVLVKKVDLKNLTCPIDEVKCPHNCTCLFRNADLGLIIDCVGRNLTQIPKTVPFKQEVKFYNEVPIHKDPNVSSEEFYVSSWRSTINHTELLLNNNNITKLPKITDQGYSHVTHLYLSNNTINETDANFYLPNLKVLTLDNNKIHQLSKAMLNYLTTSAKIERLTLHNNPWICNGSTIELLNFMHQKVEKIPHLSNITCASDKREVFKLSVYDLCQKCRTDPYYN